MVREKTKVIDVIGHVRRLLINSLLVYMYTLFLLIETNIVLL